MAKIDATTLTRILDRLYERALAGVPGSQSVEALVAEYEKGAGTIEERIDTFVKWQTAKCATSGFVTGLGGFATLPVTIPADLTANFYVQLRMIAVIARLRGHDPSSDKVKTLAYVCLAGNQAKDAVKMAGIQASQAAVSQILRKLSAKTVSNLGRLVPLVGGVVGGAIDAAACRAVAVAARKIFEEPSKN
jgi:hypothetical protein